MQYTETAVWSHLLIKSLMENFIFCVVRVSTLYFDQILGQEES